MVYVGLDDTDMLDTPGTVKLARQLAVEFSMRWRTLLITRHQLLKDPRVPCTRQNGCVAMAVEPLIPYDTATLEAEIAARMIDWCPPGSDPGLCLVDGDVPQEVVDFGRLCQAELTTQSQARAIAERYAIPLQGLGGTNDGVIGALAAVGLASTADDGRVVFLGRSPIDHHLVSGIQDVDELTRLGVDEVRRLDDGKPVAAGRVELEKRLRPVLRRGKVVLYVSPIISTGAEWHAERVV